jgi:hypothetical protein
VTADPPPTDAIAVAARLSAALLLLAIAALQALYGLVAGPFGALALGNAPHLLLPHLAWLRGGAAALGFVAASLGIATLTAVAAVGLAVAPRRGWWLGLAAALLWLPTGCVPLSALVLAALFVPGVRPAAPAPPAPTAP